MTHIWATQWPTSSELKIKFRDAARGRAGGAAAPPDFGRSEGAAGQRRRAAACRITTCPPPDFWPLLHPWHGMTYHLFLTFLNRDSIPTTRMAWRYMFISGGMYWLQWKPTSDEALYYFSKFYTVEFKSFCHLWWGIINDIVTYLHGPHSWNRYDKKTTMFIIMNSKDLFLLLWRLNNSKFQTPFHNIFMDTP